ncbi:choice-of-anchor D domain-containing protein [Kribbella sp. NPDC050124]|uniref:choice-of-anchor D domain-containing protein n=1 Tax=Kribbella sp. NPDC050124 TaxID=3364114 RepID=UPI0037BA7EC8
MRRARRSALFRYALAAALAAITIPFIAHASFGEESATTPVAQVFPTRQGIGVTWTDIDNATGYRVERKQTTDWQDISGALSDATTTWIDETIAPGATADYRVVATSDTPTTSPEVKATRAAEAPTVGDIDVLSLDANRGRGTTWLQDETASPVTASAPADGARTLTAGSLKVKLPAFVAGPGYYDLPSPTAVTLSQGDRSCTSAATLRVTAVTYTADLQLETLAAWLAAGTCADATPVAWFEIRYKSAVDYQALSVTPDTLDAGQVMVGTSKDLTLTLKNTGSERVQFGNMTLNTATAQFKLTRNCDQYLPPGSSCLLTLTFEPERAGDFAARLTIDDSTALSSHQVLMTGIGTSLPPAPAAPGVPRTYRGVTVSWPTWKTAGGTPVRGYYVHRYVDGAETTKWVDADPNRPTMSWNELEPTAGTEYALSIVNELGDGPVGQRRALPRPTAQIALTDRVSTELLAASLGGYVVQQDLGNSVEPKGPVAAAPDGRTLAWVATSSDKSLWTQRVEPGGVGEPVKLWTPQVAITHLSWSPDGTRIAFQAPENGTPCVYVIPATGGTPEKVACDLASPSWMPDGTTLVVVDRRFDGDDRFTRVRAAAGGARVATLPAPTAAADGMPARVSPDGRKVAFGAGDTVKYVDFSTDQVTSSKPLEGAIRSLSWDPDSSVVVAATGAGGLYRLDSEILYLTPLALPTGLLRGGDLDLAWQRLGVTIAPTPAVVGREASVAFDGSALLPGTTFTCSVHGNTVSPCQSPYTAPNLSSGDNLVTITSTEPDGRVTKAYRILTADTTGPVARMVAPTYQSSVAATASLAVSATDANGVASYDVRYRRATSAGPYGDYVLPWTNTTDTSMNLTVAAGYEYCVSVRAKDKLGNVGQWSAERCFSRPLDDRSLTLASTGWTRATGSTFYYGTTTQTTTYGKSLTRTVQGKRFFLIATRCPTCGSVAVYAGNKYLTTVNLAYPTTHRQVVLGLPVQTTLFSGTLKFVSASSGKLIQIDGLAVGRT